VTGFCYFGHGGVERFCTIVLSYIKAFTTGIGAGSPVLILFVSISPWIEGFCERNLELSATACLETGIGYSLNPGTYAQTPKRGIQPYAHKVEDPGCDFERSVEIAPFGDCILGI